MSMITRLQAKSTSARPAGEMDSGKATTSGGEKRTLELPEDSGVPASPSCEETQKETPIEIPTMGGPVFDHATKATEGDQRLRHPRPPSMTSLRASKSVREAERKRIEYEAELELYNARQSLLQKKKALQLAQLAAEEEEEQEQTMIERDLDAEGRIGDWIDDSQHHVHHEGLTMPTPIRTEKEGNGRRRSTAIETEPKRETSAERKRPHGRAIEELATSLKSMMKPRPTPRAFYELPTFHGDPAEWLLFKRRYEDSTASYEFKPTENLVRLQTTIQGKAKVLVEDLLRSASHPKEIMDALERTYGNPNVLLQLAIKKVRSLPKVNDNDGNALRQFSSAVRSCVSTMKNIKADGYINNPQMVRELLDKLTPAQKAEYGKFARRKSEQSGVDLRISPTLTVLVEFLEELADTSSFLVSADIITPATSTVPKKTSAPQRVVHKVLEMSESTTSVAKCSMCDGDHKLPACPDFRKLEVDKKWEWVKSKRLCFKCLIKTHSKFNCRAKRCAKCNYGHHSLLHNDKFTSATSEFPVEEGAPASSPETVTSICGERLKSLLKVIPVSVQCGNKSVNTYALLDDGATVSLIDESLVPSDGGKNVPLHIVSASGHELKHSASRIVRVEVRGPNQVSHHPFVRTIRGLKLPPQTVSAEVVGRCGHLRGLEDVTMQDAIPQIILGQDNWELIVGGDVRRGKAGQPVASLTALGWVVHGPISPRFVTGGGKDSVNQVVHSDLNELIKHQFDLDSIGIVEQKRIKPDEERAISILEKTTCLTENGWQVGLLWKRDRVEFPDNYQQVLKRLHGVERKMDRDPIYADAYCAQVDRLLDNGYAHKVEDSVSYSPTWYLPHFGVTNVNKPGKLRLVFDAAAAYKGTSLNDNLLSGPVMLNSLLGSLFKFRSGPIAVSADIADMFLRVKIRRQDQGAQLFLWRGKDRTREPDIYVMDSMIFGAASSPTTAIFVLNKNAERFQKQYPDAVHAIRTRHYMDDYLDSLDTVDKAIEMVTQISDIHKAGNFHIRGWATNNEELRSKFTEIVPESIDLTKLGSEAERTLGLIWATGSDQLSFDLSFKKLDDSIRSGKEIPTKREFLKFIMSVFDPLGLVCPLVINARILLQKIWKSGIGWDEKLNNECFQVWQKWLDSLRSIKELKIPRWYGLTSAVDMHVFGDASGQAYAAVAYFVDENGHVALVVGKARVAPLKVVSMPRLELQAALLACRLAETVEKEHEINIKSKTLWSDSKTVLHWIRSDPKDYKPFVSDRLAEIDVKSKGCNWQWVPTHDNPADEATRQSWSIENSKWVSGPSFLSRPQSEWPSEDNDVVIEEAASELRASQVHTTVAMTPSPLIDASRFSTWTRAIRTVARVLAIVRKWKSKETAQVTADDIKKAELLLLKQSQSAVFSSELETIQAGNSLSPKNRLSAIDPMLKEDGLLRVRGRLIGADIPFNERHPIILDGREPLARLLVRDYHVKALHANTETVVNLLRERYWILRLRPTVKGVATACQLCRIRKAQPQPPKMGDVPMARMAHHQRPFTHTGIDYFGPIEVTVGRRREKRWGVLFTCMTVRAIHLEVAASLSADSALMALRRFFARRGQPAVIYSDRGTNFVGAASEMRRVVKSLSDNLREEAVTKGIEWKFISPSSPHMGGCWERLVRSTKVALKAIMKERAPRDETLLTLFAEVESTINSRPLTHVPVDPRDPIALTPNHLILGSASGIKRWGNFTESDLCTRKQWQIAQTLADLFWKRWLREYLPALQSRSKWRTPVRPVQVGDIVVVCDHLLPRGTWPRGKVVTVFTGPDGQVRVVDIRTSHGVLRRPVHKLAVLPTAGDIEGASLPR